MSHTLLCYLKKIIQDNFVHQSTHRNWYVHKSEPTKGPRKQTCLWPTRILIQPSPTFTVLIVLDEVLNLWHSSSNFLHPLLGLNILLRTIFWNILHQLFRLCFMQHVLIKCTVQTTDVFCKVSIQMIVIVSDFQLVQQVDFKQAHLCKAADLKLYIYICIF